MKKLLLILLAFVFVGGCELAENKKLQNVENKLEGQAIKYYNDKLKDNVVGVKEYTITLLSLSNAGYDVIEIINPKTNNTCNDQSSVIIKLDEKAKEGYTTEVDLVCEK